MKSILALGLLAAAALSACGETTSRYEVIASRPVLDYCKEADITANLLKHPSRSLMGNMREWRAEMTETLAAQEQICAAQKAGTAPPAGGRWPA